MNAIFVLGAPRSGTTIISRHIRSAEGCFGFRSKAGKKEKDRGEPFKMGNGGSAWDEALRSGNRQAAREMVATTARDCNRAHVFVNKKISNVNHMQSICGIFPEALAVYVIRHPYDVVQSILSQRIRKLKSADARWGVFAPETPAQDPDPVVDCALQLRYLVEKIERDVVNFSRCCIVPYEAYCRNPEQTLEEIWHHYDLKSVPPPENIAFKSYEKDRESLAKIQRALGRDLYESLVDRAR